MVISGFSGAGKGTLVKKLLSEYDNYALSISMTTRGPREGEQDGREYFFRTREQFEENIAKNRIYRVCSVLRQLLRNAESICGRADAGR